MRFARLLLASSLSAAMACGGRAPMAAPRPSAVPVQTAPVVRKDVPVFLDGLGTVTAFQTVTVKPQVDGKLEKVLFREGQTVKKGDLLAQIDPRPFLIQLHQAEAAAARDRATLAGARRDLVRYRELAERKLAPQQQADDQAATVGQLEGTLGTDEAAIENAKLELDYARITSPIDGVTGVRQVDAGNLIHQADPSGLVVIVQIDPVALLFTLPEEDLPRVSLRLAEGPLEVDVYGRDGGARLGQGRLELVDNQINQATATLKLKAILPNPSRLLWPNQFVKARLLVETRKGALVVPQSAVQRGPKGTFVYVVGPKNEAEERMVDVELVEGPDAIVQGTLAPGEQVVVEGQNQLKPGAQVAPRRAESKAGAKGEVSSVKLTPGGAAR